MNVRCEFRKRGVRWWIPQEYRLFYVVGGLLLSCRNNRRQLKWREGINKLCRQNPFCWTLNLCTEVMLTVDSDDVTFDRCPRCPHRLPCCYATAIIVTQDQSQDCTLGLHSARSAQDLSLCTCTACTCIETHELKITRLFRSYCQGWQSFFPSEKNCVYGRWCDWIVLILPILRSLLVGFGCIFKVSYWLFSPVYCVYICVK